MSKWISVDDDQPREGESVLVFDERETHSKIYTMQFREYSLACIMGEEFSESYIGITRWMPLPEPPETNKE